MWDFLHGIRILDLSRLLPGPYATLLLADLGAEVVKIEQPGAGDPLRAMPPFLNGWSTRFAMLNRNKKSVAVNLKCAEGREILLRMVERADALLETFRPGVTERLGIDYASVCSVNPRLVYCSLSGYGQTGPYRDRVGHDVNYVGIAGLLSLTGQDGPELPGVPVADLAGGMFAALTLLAALGPAARTGRGVYLDLSMTDAVLSWLTIHFAEYFATGTPPKPGEAVLLGQFPCYSIYETADGKHLSVGALEPKFWSNLCRALNRGQYTAHQYNPEMREPIAADFRALFKTRTRQAWLEQFAGQEVPVAPVNNLVEALADPQVRDRGLVRPIVSKYAHFEQIAFPARVPGRTESPGQPPPGMGQHTREVLISLGYDAGQIATLKDRGVIDYPL